MPWGGCHMPAALLPLSTQTAWMWTWRGVRGPAKEARRSSAQEVPAWTPQVRFGPRVQGKGFTCLLTAWGSALGPGSTSQQRTKGASMETAGAWDVL
jgi:hypothetical protein